MTGYVTDSDDHNEAFMIHEIARQTRTLFDRRANKLGLTRSQWHVLAVLRRNEGITQVGLAHLMEIEPISLVRLLDRMEAADMIERRRDVNDRRANRIYLSPKVKPLIAQMRAMSLSLRKDALEGISESEHSELISMLKKFKCNLTRLLEKSYEE